MKELNDWKEELLAIAERPIIVQEPSTIRNVVDVNDNFLGTEDVFNPMPDEYWENKSKNL